MIANEQSETNQDGEKKMNENKREDAEDVKPHHLITFNKRRKTDSVMWAVGRKDHANGDFSRAETITIEDSR